VQVSLTAGRREWTEGRGRPQRLPIYDRLATADPTDVGGMARMRWLGKDVL